MRPWDNWYEWALSKICLQHAQLSVPGKDSTEGVWRLNFNLSIFPFSVLEMRRKMLYTRILCNRQEKSCTRIALNYCHIRGLEKHSNMGALGVYTEPLLEDSVAIPAPLKKIWPQFYCFQQMTMDLDIFWSQGILNYTTSKFPVWRNRSKP